MEYSTIMGDDRDHIRVQRLSDLERSHYLTHLKIEELRILDVSQDDVRWRALLSDLQSAHRCIQHHRVALGLSLPPAEASEGDDVANTPESREELSTV